MTSIPTIADLYSAILADLQTEYGAAISPFGKAWLRAQAAVQAGKLKLFYLQLGKLQKNIFVDTAEPEAGGGTLERFGRVKIGRNPFPATQAQYELTISVEDPLGGEVPAGTTFISNDDSQNPGMLYVVDAGSTVAYPTDSIVIRALQGGTGSRLASGNNLTATAPLLNVEAQATVVNELAIPIDAETTEDYRAKVVQSYRLYPQGGASADYRLWGLDANGVKQIYPYAAYAAPNEVNVYVEATGGASADGMGSPTQQILDDVTADIETDPLTGKGRRPLGVFAVNVQGVNINRIDITIPGATSITAANRALINAALKQAVDAVRPFIPGADVLAERNDTFGINNIITTILLTVPGAAFAQPTMTVTADNVTTPVNSIVFDNGNIPFLTSVNYA